MLAAISMLSLTFSAMPPPQQLGPGVDCMTYLDATNHACMAFSSFDVIHVSVMALMSMSPPSRIDYNILVFLPTNLAFIRHFMLVILPVLCLVVSRPGVLLTTLGLII